MLENNILNRAKNSAHIEQKIELTHETKKSSMVYDMAVYRILSSLKTENKLISFGGIHSFVNEAVKEKIERDFPDFIKK